MPKRLTQEEYEARVRSCVGDKYTVVSQYMGKSYPITLHCNIHNTDFTVSAECFMRGSSDIRGKCPECLEEEREIRFSTNNTEVECAYCGKHFYRKNSKLDGSKSGLYFCCREHKDAAQRISSGAEFDIMRPDHYGKEGTSNYRMRALQEYPNKCAVCGWDEDVDILQVHHIDENRKNCDISNLIVLCPTCHWKLTTHKYKLIDREKIIPC